MDKDQEIDRLNKKIATMRALLWEWNCSSGPVWEYWRLADVGETETATANSLSAPPLNVPRVGGTSL
jgi:hypothetical protein